MLRQLGAEVRLHDLWDDFGTVVEQARVGGGIRAMVFEAGDRPDLAAAALRAARKVPELAETSTLLTLPPRQVTSFDPASGFDDFLIVPCVPAEIYARIRKLEWNKSEFATEERLKIGTVVVDRAAHEVSVDGRHVTLTAKEFALLAFLAANRGRVYSREALLARVWGSRYEGGARTVDIHVRRLRAKLGETLPLETLRGAGYKLRAPEGTTPAPVPKRSPSEGGRR
jgi:DNA-binding winged helix-turn-helix (wHTH) protein